MALPGSRADVLRAVHEQAQLLSNNNGIRQAQQQHGHHAWTSTMWHAAFEYLFYTDPQASHDDLLFFVLKGAGHQGGKVPPYIVHRRALQVPAAFGITGSEFNAIDWGHTALLNLVLQAHYQLAVVKCRSTHLPRVAEGLLAVGEDTVMVAKTVYASPARTTVNLQTAKAHTHPAPAYPNIYFHIDDFDGAFADVVLHEPDDCFCVVLRALPMAAHGTAQQQPSDTGTAATAADVSAATDSDAAQNKLVDNTGQAVKHLVLFSGYVVHKQIEEYLGDKLHQQPLLSIPRLLGRLFSPKAGIAESQSPLRHLVLMNGPAGIGQAEVAVAAGQSSAACDAALQRVHPLQQGAVTVDTPKCALQCALMSVSLPVGHLTTTVLQVMLDSTSAAPADPAG